MALEVFVELAAELRVDVLTVFAGLGADVSVG